MISGNSWDSGFDMVTCIPVVGYVQHRWCGRRPPVVLQEYQGGLGTSCGDLTLSKSFIGGFIQPYSTVYMISKTYYVQHRWKYVQIEMCFAIDWHGSPITNALYHSDLFTSMASNPRSPLLRTWCLQSQPLWSGSATRQPCCNCPKPESFDSPKK